MQFKMLKMPALFMLFLILAYSMAQNVVAQSDYRFVYVYQTQQGAVGIGIVDPTANPASAEMATVAVEQHWFLSEAAKSIGDEWIALAFRAGDGQAVRLINVRSKEIRDIATGILLSPAPDALIGPKQEFAWSPDGQYLALNTYDVQRRTTDTLLYSVDKNLSIMLTNDSADQSRLAWSADSRQLAVATVNCIEQCLPSIDLFDPSTRSRTASLNINEAVGANLGRAGVCYMAWSPDDKYLSFMATCDGSAIDAYKEMYILEVPSGTLTRVTDITYQQEQQKPDQLFAHYEPTWIDNQTLLISTIHGIGKDLQSETLIYNVATKSVNKISDHFISSWAVNPVSQALAFASIGTDSVAYQQLSEAQPVGIVPFSILTTSGQNVDVLYPSITAPTGCDLTWSPDGTILAYVIPKGGDCRGAAESFGFIRDTLSTQYQPAFEDGEPFSVLPLGWIRYSG